MLKILTTVLCLLLSSCLVGPNYKEPAKPVADRWLINDPTVKPSSNQNANWWHVFRDPTLTCLINLGYQNNLTVQSAGVNVLKARAQLAQSVGELYPQQQALTGDLTYHRIGGSSLQGILPNNFWTASLGATATWEIDFWGKYRRAILSNNALFLSSFAAYDQALVSLTSDIATVYIDIRTTQELIRITKQNIQVQFEGYKIATARYTAGQTNLIDVEQAKTTLAQTQAEIPKLLSQLQQKKDLLGVLLGTTPDKVDGFLGINHGIPSAPAGVAVGIPLETLAKRPDIYQARMEAIAQSEAIGAIKANLFPAFSLSGTFTFSANTIGKGSLSHIFRWSNHTVTAGPSFSWPVLNYGQITNAVRVQDAAFQQALLDYLNAVLKAQQEVQDQITKFIETKKAARYLNTANYAAVKTTKLAMIRFKEGESDFTPVLIAEREQLRVQTNLTNTIGDIPKALVALYRALGGGWQIRNGNDIVPNNVKAEMAARTNWGSLLKQQNHEPPKTKAQQTKELYLPNW